MTQSDPKPTVVRRRLGKRLADLREEAGLLAEDVPAHLCSRTKLWRIEHGRTPVRVGDALALARLYEVDPGTTDELVALAEASTSIGYLEEGATRKHLGLYGDLEADAAAIATYNSEMVPGLLQTSDYIRAVMTFGDRLSNEVAEQRVAFRLHRQRAFFDRPRPGRLDAVITAGVLRVLVGSPTVMEGQIARLRAIDEREGVSIRVLPFECGLHRAMAGPFVLLGFDDLDDPDLAYVESLVGRRYIEKPEHVTAFRIAFEEVRARALPIEEYVQ